MKAKGKSGSDQEPIGIVISRGARGDQRPTFSAYVWGPAPEVPDDGRDGKIG